MCVRVCVCVRTCVFVYQVCLYVRVYVCIYIYTYPGTVNELHLLSIVCEQCVLLSGCMQWEHDVFISLVRNLVCMYCIMQQLVLCTSAPFHCVHVLRQEQAMPSHYRVPSKCSQREVDRHFWL